MAIEIRQTLESSGLQVHRLWEKTPLIGVENGGEYASSIPLRESNGNIDTGFKQGVDNWH
jgi:hypothetical protein